LDNYCQDCLINKQKYNNNIIFFDELKNEDEKLFQIENQLKSVRDWDNSLNNQEVIECIKINDSYYENLSKYEETRFKKLIKIIINDYKNYPNYSHFFNIKNILDFFKTDISNNEKKEQKRKSILIKNNEPIIIEYFNNNPYKTKLFSKIFVKNNKNNFKIEIEGQILDLIEEYEFKRKNKIVRIKLFIKNGVTEINMYKMFANCLNLIYIDGISKLNKIKIINIDKVFYNCISLSSILDFNEFELQKYNPYLMFYNCLSLINFPNEEELKINNYEDGIIITKYLKYNKEITISNIIKDNKGYFKLFRYKFKIKNKEIMIFDGKDNNCLL